MKPNPTNLAGWGRLMPSRADLYRPERLSELSQAWSAHGQRSMIARGLGRSYGDAASCRDGDVILMTRLDHLVSFDADTGMLVAEAGMSHADILRLFLPRGWLLPVTPGTSFVTLGGSVAMDVHGKNHDRVGSFGQHVQWLDMILPTEEERRVDPHSYPEILAATIGGCGLTGIIRRVGVKLQRVPSPYVQVREVRLNNLDHFMAELASVRDKASYAVGWIDAVAKGPGFGRGILETAEPIEVSTPISPMQGAGRNVPIDFPSFLLNRYSVAAFNALYWRRIPPEGRSRLRHYRDFLYPLDRIGHWNRIYGKRGFRQFQCVVPDDMAGRAIPKLLETVVAEGAASFLSVLKTLGGSGLGYLSFPMRGFTLALDLPETPHSVPLLRKLEGLTLDHGGRIYLAKDSALTPEGFAQMYPRLTRLRDVLDEINPQGIMQSDLSRRLRIRS